MKKAETAADLVPVSVLMTIAKRVRARAAEIAKAKNVPLRTANEIGIPAPKVTQSQIQINITISPKLAAFEWGSGIHASKGTPSKYPISVKNAPFLVFPGTNDFEGILVNWRKTIAHPGVAARPFLSPAKQQTRQQNLEDIRKANLANMRLIISGMKRVV